MEYSLGMWALRQAAGGGEDGVWGLIEYFFICLFMFGYSTWLAGC